MSTQSLCGTEVLHTYLLSQFEPYVDTLTKKSKLLEVKTMYFDIYSLRPPMKHFLRFGEELKSVYYLGESH